MTRYLSVVALGALVASLLLSSALVGTALAQTPCTVENNCFGTALNGPGGNGTATVRLNPGQGTVCYSMTLNLLKDPTAAHIHRGDASITNGQIVVRFFDSTPAAVGTLEDCVQADATVISDILANRAGFYVNVHNADYPGGAIRGQIGQQ
jgi:hypothetical protein